MSNVQNKKYATLAEVRSKEFLGHPVGLWALFTTEMWERFCYYGMRALLVLYLISTLTDSNPGFGWTEQSANELYGWFTGMVYLFPLLGGYLADRFLGQHRSVLLGGVLMALGEFCLFYTEYFRQTATTTITSANAPTAFWCFMFGLFLITLGNGFFKPCISVMVGELYEKNDPRRDDAFNIFYMGINVGAFFSPLVAGSIGEKVSWHWGFLTAAIGMTLGLITYSCLRPKYLGAIGMKSKGDDAESTENASQMEEAKKAAAKEEAKEVNKKAPLSRVEIDRIAVILTLTFFCIAFWSVFEQAGTSLNIFADKETNRQVPHAVGRNVPGFLANQDEFDAKNAVRALESNLYELNRLLQNSATQTSETSGEKKTVLPLDPIALAEFEVEEFASSEEILTELQEATAAVQDSYDNAKSSLDKANEARIKAGQALLTLETDDFAALLQKSAAEQEEINKLVDEAFQARAEEFADADEEAIDSFKQGLRKDVEKRLQNEFVASEKKKIDPETAVYTFPTTWYQSINPLCVVIFAPLFNVLWGALRRRKLEPSTPVKFGIGLVLLSIAFLFMILGALHSVRTHGNAGAYWLLCTYVFCTWGELCLSPVGLSMVSRLAPAKYASLLMGVWFLSSAVAGYLSGKLAAVLGSSGGRVAFWFGDKGGLADFFLIMTLAPMIAGLVVFCLAPKLRKMMHEDK